MPVVPLPSSPEWAGLLADWTRGLPPVRPATRTLPEQIADELGAALVAGKYPHGARLREQELADSFQVSRGPVREALRLLQRRGLVDVVPRKGAQAHAVTLNSIADLFNVRTALSALAARQAALGGDAGYLETLRRRVAELQGFVEDDAAAVLFANTCTRAVRTIVKSSGNAQLLRLMGDLSEQTVWQLIWTYPLDFTTRARRADQAALYQTMLQSIEAGRPARAETLVREALDDTRDAAISVLAELRGEAVEPTRLLRSAD